MARGWICAGPCKRWKSRPHFPSAGAKECWACRSLLTQGERAARRKKERKEERAAGRQPVVTLARVCQRGDCGEAVAGYVEGARACPRHLHVFDIGPAQASETRIEDYVYSGEGRMGGL